MYVIAFYDKLGEQKGMRVTWNEPLDFIEIPKNSPLYLWLSLYSLAFFLSPFYVQVAIYWSRTQLMLDGWNTVVDSAFKKGNWAKKPRVFFAKTNIKKISFNGLLCIRGLTQKRGRGPYVLMCQTLVSFCCLSEHISYMNVLYKIGDLM